MTIQKCSVCTLKKDEQHFKRKNKKYKTCNKCSNYYISRRKKISGNSNNNKNNEKIINTNTLCTSDNCDSNDNNKIQSGNSNNNNNSQFDNSNSDNNNNNTPSQILSRLFVFGSLFPVSIQDKYQYIQQLEKELLNEIDVLAREGSE